MKLIMERWRKATNEHTVLQEQRAGGKELAVKMALKAQLGGDRDGNLDMQQLVNYYSKKTNTEMLDAKKNLIAALQRKRKAEPASARRSIDAQQLLRMMSEEEVQAVLDKIRTGMLTNEQDISLDEDMSQPGEQGEQSAELVGGEQLVADLTGADMGELLQHLETRKGERPAESQFVERAKEYLAALDVDRQKAMAKHQQATRNKNTIEKIEYILQQHKEMMRRQQMQQKR